MKNAMKAKNGVQMPSSSARPEQSSPSGTRRAKTPTQGIAMRSRYECAIEPGAAFCIHPAS